MKIDKSQNIAIAILSLLLVILIALIGVFRIRTESRAYYTFNPNQQDAKTLSLYFGFPEEAMAYVLSYYVDDGWGGHAEFIARIDREYIEELVASLEEPAVSGDSALTTASVGSGSAYTEVIRYQMDISQVTGSEKPIIVDIELRRLDYSDFYYCYTWNPEDILSFYQNTSTN